MTYKELKNQIKEEQKALAQKITRGKHLRKPKNRVNPTKEDLHRYYYYSNYTKEYYFTGTDDLCMEYRHRHIVYCMLFNKTPYEKIENPRDDNRPSKYRLEKIRKEWEAQIDEAFCDRS